MFLSSLTPSSYMSAFLRGPLCKSPLIEAVAVHKSGLLQVRVTFFIYLCIHIALTHVQCAKISFFFLMDGCTRSRVFVFEHFRR